MHGERPIENEYDDEMSRLCNELEHLRAARAVPLISYWTFGLGLLLGCLSTCWTLWGICRP